MNETISKIIGQNINALLSLRKKKQKELAEFLSVPDNTISYFVSGKRMPNTEQIIKMTEFFNTAADYLLGLSVVPDLNTDVETKQICDYTGLSEKAINRLNDLMQYNTIPQYSKIANEFIEDFINDFVIYVFDYYVNRSEYEKCTRKYKEYESKTNHTDKEDKEINALYDTYTDTKDRKDLALFRLERLTTNFAEWYYCANSDYVNYTVASKMANLKKCINIISNYPDNDNSNSGSDCSDNSNSEGGV